MAQRSQEKQGPQKQKKEGLLAMDAGAFTNMLKFLSLKELLTMRQVGVKLDLVDSAIALRHKQTFPRCPPGKSVEAKIKDLLLHGIEKKLNPIPPELCSFSKYGLNDVWNPTERDLYRHTNGEIVAALVRMKDILLDMYPADHDAILSAFYKRLQDTHWEIESPEARHYMSIYTDPSLAQKLMLRVRNSPVVSLIKTLRNDLRMSTAVVSYGLVEIGMILDLDKRWHILDLIQTEQSRRNRRLDEMELDLLREYYHHRCHSLGLDPNSKWGIDHQDLIAHVANFRLNHLTSLFIATDPIYAEYEDIFYDRPDLLSQVVKWRKWGNMTALSDPGWVSLSIDSVQVEQDNIELLPVNLRTPYLQFFMWMAVGANHIPELGQLGQWAQQGQQGQQGQEGQKQQYWQQQRQQRQQRQEQQGLH